MDSMVDEANELVESNTNLKDDKHKYCMAGDVEPYTVRTTKLKNIHLSEKDSFVCKGDEPYVGMEFESQWDAKNQNHSRESTRIDLRASMIVKRMVPEK